MRFPKPVPRLTDRTAQRAQQAAAWRRCCLVVDQRDGYRCRVCARRVRRTLALCPERLERHHLVPRSLAPQFWACAWNIVTTCATCHGKLTRHELVAVGSTACVVDGISFLDASGELSFVRAASAI